MGTSPAGSGDTGMLGEGWQVELEERGEGRNSARFPPGQVLGNKEMQAQAHTHAELASASNLDVGTKLNSS